MKLPLELHVVIASALGYLVGEGLQSLGRLLKIDLSGHYAAIVSVLSALLIAAVDGALALIPAEYHQFVQIVMVVLVAVFAPAGLHSTIKKFMPTAPIEVYTEYPEEG